MKRTKEQIEHSEALEVVLVAAKIERYCQIKKWGLQTHHWSTWCQILSEEVGELNKAFLEADVLMEPPEEWANERHQAYSEAIQVAAVALAIAQQLRTDKPV